MAKTYTKSEMTPELLHLNLLHFFEAPSREYKAGIDEIVLSTDCDEERWLKIMNCWFDFMENQPVESTHLRNLAENLVKTATEKNIETVLEVFDGLEGFISSAIKTDDEQMLDVVSSVTKLKNAIYDGTATEEREKKYKLLEEKRTNEEELEAERLKSKTSEQKAIDALQAQITELGETIEQMSKNPDTAVSQAAQRLVNDAKIAANSIADRMESQVTTERSEEEIKKQEELILRADEKLEFERDWGVYAHKYTKKDTRPTSDLFKKFLIDAKGLTPDQVDEIAVEAAFYGDEMGNFLEFDEELIRVKTKKSE